MDKAIHPPLLFAALSLFALGINSLAAHAAIDQEKRDAQISWPLVAGTSDPNAIVHTDARHRAYIASVSTGIIHCGIGTYTVEVDGRQRTFTSGLELGKFGRRFRADHLIRFLQSRPENEHAVRPYVVPAGDPDFPKLRGREFRLHEMDLGVAMSVLGDGKVRQSIPVLVKLLDDPEKSVRRSAAASLSRFSDEPAVVELLVGERGGKRIPDVAFLLAEVGPPALPGLVSVLQEGEPRQRAAARQAIWDMIAMDRLDKKTVPLLVEVLKLDGADVRSTAVEALKRLGPDAAEAVPALIEIVRMETDDLRLEAIVALTQIGSAASPAIPVLRELRTTEDERTRRVASAAIRTIRSSAERERP